MYQQLHSLHQAVGQSFVIDVTEPQKKYSTTIIYGSLPISMQSPIVLEAGFINRNERRNTVSQCFYRIERYQTDLSKIRFNRERYGKLEI